jgi:hypothetical protein
MLTVFPIAFFGNVEYFKELAISSNPIFEVKEHILKGTIRSRCEILSPNGVQQLNIPLFRPNGSKTLIDHVELSAETDWQVKIWRSIKTAYSSAPFFDHYGMEVEELIFQKEKNLCRYTSNITERILEWLSIPVELNFSTEYMENSIIQDFRLSDFNSLKEMPFYQQVFSTGKEFNPNLSILDLIFCEGPMARNWILN